MPPHKPMPPLVEEADLSDEAKLALSLANVFYEAACTDCYVTRALVEALENGISLLSENDFSNMIMEIEDDIVLDCFTQARGDAKSRFGPAPRTEIY